MRHIYIDLSKGTKWDRMENRQINRLKGFVDFTPKTKNFDKTLQILFLFSINTDNIPTRNYIKKS